MAPAAAILAVDGGNSKTELLLAAADGRLLAHARGPTISHQAIAPGFALTPRQRADLGMERLADLARQALNDAASTAATGPIARVGVLCVAGADFASDERLLLAALRRQGIVEEQFIFNDAFAPLRAGTDRPYGVSVICGAGVNAAAIAPDGRTARFPALGAISGDWGGSSGVGMAGLIAAVRARDGRGPRTALAELVPRHFGVARPQTVTRHLYEGRIAEDRIRELSPVVFDAAIKGDAVARDIVDRLADELATMAIALARRLRMTRDRYDVVLAGGVFRTPDRAFVERIRDRVRAALPGASVQRLDAPPVLGAAPEAQRRLRRELGTRSTASP
jgi:N-acetylglucosamine kinase-like BadF-type ATPase